MAITEELSGAKASNAGDDFHVLWALQRTLRVLDPSSGLYAVTVEGLPSQDVGIASRGAWEGVDVALFYGGSSLSTAYRIEIAQLKYSTGYPSKAWTLARLCKSTRKKGNNSVVARLAKAYNEVLRLAGQSAKPAIVVKLVSNQPIHGDVLRTIEAGTRQVISRQPKALRASWKGPSVREGLGFH
jgi:hypothetical protein